MQYHQQSVGENSLQAKHDIMVYKHNDVYLQVVADKGTIYEIADYFSFYAPNYKFNPKFKNKIWDGRIRLMNISTKRMYLGLWKQLKKFAELNDYTIWFDTPFNETSGFEYNEKEIASSKFVPRDYQIDAVKFALENKRCVLLSPTGSGKSFIIYMIMKHLKKRTLIIVPTINLVYQISNDFIGYNKNAKNWIHQIMGGEEKDSDKPIVVSTWQSLINQPKEWFNQFEVVIGDECHLFKAQSLSKVMESCENIQWRIGTTGTTSNADAKVHELTLEGLFGPIKKVSTTKNLMDQNHLSQFKIEILVLKYDDETGKAVRKMNYSDEINFFVENEKRNRFIAKLACSQKNNTLVLFQFVEKHGNPLYELIKKYAPDDKKVHFIHGNIDGDIREQIRNEVNNSENNIIVGSYGTYSTGIDLPNLHNIIFATAYKSKIKNLQSIGRGLRNSDGKEIATLYDLVDDCSIKSKKNFSIQHFLERIKIYNEEKFSFKIHNINF